jgi:predicted nucleic acid-binding protein
MILDASVAAKWFLADEDMTLEALAVRDALVTERIRLAAPPAIWTEVGDGIVRSVRRRLLGSADAVALAHEAEELLRLVGTVRVEMSEIVRTALSVEIGAYDAEYLAAALQQGSSVITADQGMLERGRAHGYDVVWLGDLTLRDGVLVDTPQGYP